MQVVTAEREFGYGLYYIINNAASGCPGWRHDGLQENVRRGLPPQRRLAVQGAKGIGALVYYPRNIDERDSY